MIKRKYYDIRQVSLILVKKVIMFLTAFNSFGPLGKSQHDIEIFINTARVSRLSFRFLWLWIYLVFCSQIKLIEINNMANALVISAWYVHLHRLLELQVCSWNKYFFKEVIKQELSNTQTFLRKNLDQTKVW